MRLFNFCACQTYLVNIQSQPVHELNSFVQPCVCVTMVAMAVAAWHFFAILIDMIKFFMMMTEMVRWRLSVCVWACVRQVYILWHFLPNECLILSNIASSRSTTSEILERARWAERHGWVARKTMWMRYAMATANIHRFHNKYVCTCDILKANKCYSKKKSTSYELVGRN